MPLVFDSFSDRAAAKRFAAAVKQQFDLGATVHDSQDDPDPTLLLDALIDLVTYELFLPIVLVERATDEENALEKENAVVQLVEQFGGEFAGT
jgi:hypothetical protein